MTNDQFIDLYRLASMFYRGVLEDYYTARAYEAMVDMHEEGLTPDQEAIAADMKSKGHSFNY